MTKPVFVSYQRADMEVARALVERLAKYGVAAWWDSGIEPGERWREAIINALNEARVFVVLHSAAAERSGEVLKELAVASSAKKVMIAIRLENRAPSGSFLYEMAALNWVDAYSDPDRELDDFARRLATSEPATAPIQTIADAVEARKIKAPILPRLIASNLALAVLLSCASGLGFFSMKTPMASFRSNLSLAKGWCAQSSTP